MSELDIRVLVVDDSEFFLETTVRKLEQNPRLRAQSASGGEAALAALERLPFDCVVSDYHMPGMDGLELYERVEAEYGLPFVILTAEGDERVASEAIGAGVDDYLMKESVFARSDDDLQLLANRVGNIVSQQRAQSKYERLLNSTPDEIVEVTVDGEILAANEAMATATGESTDPVGRQLSAVLPEAVATERLERGRRAIAMGSPVTFQDSIGIRRFHNIAVPVSATSVEDSVQLVSREITLQKRYEREIEDKNRELALINRIVRHDINNEVQLLVGWAEFLSDHVDEPGAEYLDRIADSCSHIDELTAIAREFIESLERGDRMELEPVSVASVLRDELEKKATQFDEATFTVEEELPTAPVRANELLSSVFANLLSNAVKHNDTPDPRVRVRARDQGTDVRVAIADDGPGVPDDRKEAIFGTDEMGPGSSGSGLGLYLVNTLVEQYGGSVRVDDAGRAAADGGVGATRDGRVDPAAEPLDGAEFVVTLPKHA